MKKHSKRYQVSEKVVDHNKAYTLKEAVAVIKNMSLPKFGGSVDLHFHLNIDSKKSDQMVRGTVVLPHGTGKTVRVAVFCRGEQERQAREAHAEYVGAQELIDKVAGGFLDLDCAIATPDMMSGLMPSPKTGTVTTDIAKAIEDVKKGKVEFRVDKQGGVHLAVGKVAFEEDKIVENASKVIEALSEARPASVKGKFINSISISASMNPGLTLAL
ncbi:MAG: 50S ribosomal protein L1 [Candidatus Omnitrophica bacterium]|nr:50S ribosomal protein L1 [Candidatus Omnitrophota bacterium]